MISVKFDHSVKYNGIRYAAHEVFGVDEKDLEELKKSGAIVISSTQNTNPPSDDDTPPNDDGGTSDTDGSNGDDEQTPVEIKEELLTYTVPQLKAFAEENGIDLTGKTAKADIYNAIVATLN